MSRNYCIPAYLVSTVLLLALAGISSTAQDFKGEFHGASCTGSLSVAVCIVSENFTTLTSLQPFTEYEVAIYANTDDGQNSKTVLRIKTNETTPSQPISNLNAYPINATSIRLTWDPPAQPNGVIAYRLYISNNNLSRFQACDTNQTFCNIVDLQEDHKYRISVTVYNIKYNLIHPTEIITSVKTPSAAPSAPPSYVRLNALGVDSIMVNWDLPPQIDRNGEIISVTVHYGISYSKNMISMTVPARQRSLKLTKLQTFTLYSFKATAETVNGSGPASPLQQILTDQDTPTASPHHPKVFDETNTTVMLAWQDPDLQQLRGILQGYYLHILDRDFNISRKVIVTKANSNISDGERRYKVQRLKPYSMYEFALQAYTSAGLGPIGRPGIGKLREGIPTGPPTNITVENIDNGRRSIFILWQPPLLENRNGFITKYCIIIAEEANHTLFYSDCITVDGNPTAKQTLLVTNLKPWTYYQIKICAATAIGNGNFSSLISHRTQQWAPFSPPRNITADAVSASEIKVNWQAPKLPNGIIAYKLIMYQSNEQAKQVYNGYKTTFSVKNLRPNRWYTFCVYAYNVGYNLLGPSSQNDSAKTLKDPPGSPVNLSVISETFDILTVSWLPPEFNQDIALATLYELFYRSTQSSTWSIINLNETRAVIPGLHAYTGYEVKVRAINPATNPSEGNFSKPRIKFTQQSGKFLHCFIRFYAAPSASPRHINATLTEPSSILVSWQELIRQERNGIIIEYLIKYSHTPNQSKEVQSHEIRVNRDVSEYTLQDLKYFTKYSIRLAASTSAGVGPFSQPINIQTNQSAPAASPKNVIIVVESSTSMTINWSPPPVDKQNGEIISYKVQYQAKGDELATKISVKGSDHSCNLHNLTINTRYFVQVAAATIIGTSQFSEVVEAKTNEDVPWSPPTKFSGSPIDHQSVNVSWLPPDKPNGQIIGYKLRYNEESLNEITYVNISNTISYQVKELKPSTSYYFSVAALTAVGEGIYTNPLRITTKRLIYPSPPMPAAVPPIIVIIIILSFLVVVTPILLNLNCTAKFLKKYSKSIANFIEEEVKTILSKDDSTSESLRLISSYGEKDATLTTKKYIQKIYEIVEKKKKESPSPPVVLGTYDIKKYAGSCRGILVEGHTCTRKVKSNKDLLPGVEERFSSNSDDEPSTYSYIAMECPNNQSAGQFLQCYMNHGSSVLVLLSEIDCFLAENLTKGWTTNSILKFDCVELVVNHCRDYCKYSEFKVTLRRDDGLEKTIDIYWYRDWQHYKIAPSDVMFRLNFIDKSWKDHIQRISKNNNPLYIVTSPGYLSDSLVYFVTTSVIEEIQTNDCVNIQKYMEKIHQEDFSIFLTKAISGLLQSNKINNYSLDAYHIQDLSGIHVVAATGVDEGPTDLLNLAWDGDYSVIITLCTLGCHHSKRKFKNFSEAVERENVHFTISKMTLTDYETNQKKAITHYHYLHWSQDDKAVDDQIYINYIEEIKRNIIKGGKNSYPKIIVFSRHTSHWNRIGVFLGLFYRSGLDNSANESDIRSDRFQVMHRFIEA
ncbi:uncharacterized protein TRIADDRAFT_64052 [Trichoplax adhaerens]|uniref:Fibronectin type-III domain-containing protein n=1 Tax=Trichoplax adhaerens TaxID=10228 RepID=B3S1D6_TRIAD|nr:hypothetical protein TRIADDRAFT_64052 [Trichoplax adhaerens]EDV22989.1 hypothetical protein TRIADDRAFT_64052 [Trichoplax adhaerens]|eukprot:XP_002113899.1 hypothetical protein TRIADDRAFT_64052 [Trichoplax adhaerens]